jgi:hypothetical protein
MRDNWVPENIEELARYLKRLHTKRGVAKSSLKLSRQKRKTLSQKEREIIIKKTDNHCHICGGPIDGPWQADHVMVFSGGGEHFIENYLPAHSMCNNYRWDYRPDEFQEILRMGVWLRTQIETLTPIGYSAGNLFILSEKRRLNRRKQNR